MNVSELYDLTQWIDSELIIKQIPQKYHELFQILQRHTQPNKPKESFETQKNELIKSLRSIALDRITKDQLSFLEKLGIAQGIGEAGIATIEDVLFRNVIDVATSAQKIQEMIAKIESGINQSNQIKAGLTGCISKEEYELKEQVLMRVSFTGHATMSNLTDFKNSGNVWYDIGRGISMAHNSSPDDVKIIGATKGSIIIELAVAYSIAATTSGILLAALKVADRVIEIKKKAEELRGLKLNNDKLAKDIEKEAEEEKEKGIEKISSDIVNKLNIKKSGEGDKVNALEKSVKLLVNFIENGGEVDFVLPEEDVVAEEGKESAEKQQTKQLRIAFEEIRKLEKKIGLLEHKKPK